MWGSTEHHVPMVEAGSKNYIEAAKFCVVSPAQHPQYHASEYGGAPGKSEGPNEWNNHYSPLKRLRRC